MSKVEIQNEKGSYAVTIGRNLISQLSPDNSIVLADSAVKKYIPVNFERIILLDANESTKTLQTCEFVIEQLKMHDANRKTNLIAIGGGYVQDISTLVASLFMRGIKWQYFPTTTMAILDSCIGGKSSINSGNFKNLIGTIYPPTSVLIDLEVTKSLNPIALACGLSEAIKISYARGQKEFQGFIDLYKDFDDLNSTNGEHLIEHVLKSKQWFIEEDEFDTGVRQLLNFGHTFGHAIEAATHFSITHGVAVGMGMLAEIRMGMLLNKCNDLPERAKHLDSYIRGLFKNIPDMVNTIRNLNVPLAHEAFISDKKHTNQSYVIVTLDKLGYLERVSIPVTDDLNQIILEIFEWVMRDFLI
jgi:3-dehydroquinate synthase